MAKFKYVDKEVRFTERIGVTREGDVVDEKRPDVVEMLRDNPFFEEVKEDKKIKKPKKN